MINRFFEWLIVKEMEEMKGWEALFFLLIWLGIITIIAEYFEIV